MMTKSILLLSLLWFGASALPAVAALECVGRCEGPGGATRIVSAGACDDASETCQAGCDASGASPQPFARCVERASGATVVRPDTLPNDARRE